MLSNLICINKRQVQHIEIVQVPKLYIPILRELTFMIHNEIQTRVSDASAVVLFIVVVVFDRFRPISRIHSVSLSATDGPAAASYRRRLESSIAK